MKIISKFKDYYDFVAGYDTDPRKVYVRDTLGPTMDAKWPKLMVAVDMAGVFFVGSVWFCDQRFIYLYDYNGKKYYYRYEDIPVELHNSYTHIRLYNRNYSHYYSLEAYFGVKKKKDKRTRWVYEGKWKWEVDNLNKQTGIPILYTYHEIGKKYVANGRLTDIEFNKIKTPQDAFTELYNWIPYHEPSMPDDPTDMSRFENKGFDKKTSFRKM